MAAGKNSGMRTLCNRWCGAKVAVHSKWTCDAGCVASEANHLHGIAVELQLAFMFKPLQEP